MDLNRRLNRIEKLAADIRPNPNRCQTCRAPIPSIPSMICLRSDGSISPGSIVCPPERCPECGGYGGVSATPYNRETGKLRGKIVVLSDDDGAEHLGDDVSRKLLGLEATGRCQTDGYRRVQVAPGDASKCICAP